jgi:hypothetical protein
MKNLSRVFLAIVLFHFTVTSYAQNKPIQTKDLEILMVADYDWVYNDGGTGAKENLDIWKPKTNLPGFYPLGYYAHGSYSKPQAVMLMVKGITSDAVRHPIDYIWRYNDSKTGGDMDVSIWEPIAPPGYKALGTVVVPHYGKPLLDAVVCVREDLVVATRVGSRIWHDAGSGGEVNGGIWRIQSPQRKNPKMTYLTSGSFICATSHNPPNVSDVAYALEVAMPTVEFPSFLTKPQLTGIKDKDAVMETTPVLSSVSFVPCIAVNDSDYYGRTKQQIEETPIYKIERYVYYKRHGWSYNDNPKDGQDLNSDFEVGMEKSVEESMEQTFETSATIEGGIESGIYSASVSVSMSYAVSHSTTISTTRSQSKSFGTSSKVPPKSAGALYTVSYKFKLINGKGRLVEEWDMDSDNSHVFVIYTP